MALSSSAFLKYSCVALVLLVSDHYRGVADAFGSHRTCVPGRQPQTFGYKGSRTSSSETHARYSRTARFLVSEEDVLEAVERAETLWAEALEARKAANALIDQAEEDAISSAGTAKQAENIFQDKTTPITMEELVQVDTAAKKSLDATSMVNKAMEASDEADRLESEAEEALKKSEERLEQHLIDFPDSLLAE